MHDWSILALADTGRPNEMTSESANRIAGALTGLIIGVVSLSVAHLGLPNLFPFYFIPAWLAISGFLHGYIFESKILNKIPVPVNSCLFWAVAFPVYKTLFDIASVAIFSYDAIQFLSVLLWWVIAGFMFGIPFSMLNNYASKLVTKMISMKQ